MPKPKDSEARRLRFSEKSYASQALALAYILCNPSRRWEIGVVVDLVSEYRSQYLLRNWKRIYRALPDVKGRTILDLGCGPGDQSRDLARRGASVIGVDFNSELIASAVSQGYANCNFIVCDITDLSPLDVGDVDGIWSSFTAAYCTDLAQVLSSWRERLKPGGWLALTEVSGLFDHQPMELRFQQKLLEFYHQRLAERGYDFLAGSKLVRTVEKIGLRVTEQFLVEDSEFSADGPLSPAAIESWSRRFSRLRRLAEFLGADFDTFREAFLRSLRDEDHRSSCGVHFVLATNRDGGVATA